MNKPTAAALIGCLIVLIVYVAITSATLVRDIDATEAAESYPADTIAQTPVLQPTTDTGLNGKKAELADIQAKSFHKRRDRITHRASKIKKEPITLLL
jgi:hypothetical protein